MENVRRPAPESEQRPVIVLQPAEVEGIVPKVELPVNATLPPLKDVEFKPPVAEEPAVEPSLPYTPKEWFGPTEPQVDVFSWDIPRPKGKAGQNGW